MADEPREPDPDRTVRRRMRLVTIVVVSIVAGVAAFAAVKRLTRPMYTAPLLPEPAGDEAVRVRRELFAEIQPVRIANCELARFGEPNDGGYLMCGNLLGEAKAGYSYGIAGYDQWGCDVSRRFGIPVHQYDCFDLDRPRCPDGQTRFHEQCLGDRAVVDEHGRRFDTLENHLSTNGDATARIVLKMDIEAAETGVLLTAPDGVFDRIDQIAIELHGTADPRLLAAVRRLKRFFYVAHLHFNNFSCWDGLDPFPASAYELLLVNRRIGEVDPSVSPIRPHPLDAPNNLRAPDCQADAR
jgi:hypothetical protein